MRVIIADDEVHICSLIRHLIKWDELGLEFAGAFSSGQEVLEYFERDTADILICDIEMPGINGIELMSRLSTARPELKIIVVSGFRRFEYAQSSMKYGVTHYLLKPIDEGELNTALRAVVDSIEHKERIKTSMSSISVRVQLHDALVGQKRLGTLEEINAKYSYHFEPGIFNVISAVLLGPDVDSDDRPLLLMMFADIVRPKLLDYCCDVEIYREDSANLCILVNYHAKDAKLAQSAFDTIFQSSIVEFACKTQCGCDVGFGTPSDSLEGVRRSLWTARCVVCDRLSNTHRHIFYASLAPARYFEHEDEYLPALERRDLMRAVECIDLDAAAAWVHNVFERNERKMTARPWLVFEYSSRVITLLLTIFGEVGLVVDDKREFSARCMARLYCCTSISETERALTEIVVNESGERLGEKQVNASAYVQQAKNYIEKHFAERITLEQMANEIHINPTYLSVIFKTTLGMNYSKYLTDVRMEEAKRLLRECALNLTQIANAVGYEKTAYFSDLFKKSTGIKPSEYRRLHQRNIGD